MIAYGALVNAVVDFIIVAPAILIVVKAVDQLRRKQELPVPPRQEVLLEEIRDILKARA